MCLFRLSGLASYFIVSQILRFVSHSQQYFTNVSNRADYSFFLELTNSLFNSRITFISVTVASSVFILTFCFLVYSVRKVNLMNSWILIRFSCLCPLGALYQGFQRIAFFENQGTFLTDPANCLCCFKKV